MHTEYKVARVDKTIERGFVTGTHNCNGGFDTRTYQSRKAAETNIKRYLENWEKRKQEYKNHPILKVKPEYVIVARTVTEWEVDK